jgi:hypothetical protein
MLRSALLDAWPLAVLLALVLGTMAVLVRRVAPHVRWRSLAELHRDDAGGVQSLSFVLTVPLFIILMLLAVQITQVMIGMMVVHYAAYAAARSATVWIPATISVDEPANCISRVNFDRPVSQGGEYVVQPANTGKFEKIRSAAVLACVPIAPSRDLGLADPGDGMTAALQNVYRALAPASTSNSRMPQRLANKWAYANANTQIEMRIFHRADEPPLTNHNLAPYPPEFADNEIGFRDKIQVTVSHRFALLPGPGRLLGPREPDPNRQPPRKKYLPPDQRGRPKAPRGPRAPPMARRPPPPPPPKVKRLGKVYYTLLTATATLGNEGEKPLVTYVQTAR